MSRELIQPSVNGVAVGSIIALAAVGLTLIYGILRLANFAHGDFYDAGGLFNADCQRDRRASSTTLPIIAIGLALFIRNGIVLVWGSENQKYDLPVASALNVFGIKVAYYRVIVGLAIVAIWTPLPSAKHEGW